MSCYHPLKRFVVGWDVDGKEIALIKPYCTEYVYPRASLVLSKYIYGDSGSYAFNSITGEVMLQDKITDFQEIPCGRCIGCRLDYSRQWANRLMLELQYHESAYFVTLTYNDAHVPISDSDTMTLRKRDIQLFMKRLRKRCGYPIRFYCAGEYGPETWRPHYHAIIFGLKLNDLVPYKRSSQNFMYYNSPFLDSVWTSEIDQAYLKGYRSSNGFVVVAPVTWDTCAYTARYVTKKLIGDAADFYDQFDLEPPFSLMSRKPGIARQWYDDHPDFNDYDFINLRTDKGGIKFRPPHYFHRLYDIDYPSDSQRLKFRRKELSVAARNAKLSRLHVSYLDYLSQREECHESSARKLLRNDI